MVYEMNKSFVTKVLIMSTVLMAGILVIPTNIHDAKANPCSNIHMSETGGNGAAGGSSGPAGDGGTGGVKSMGSNGGLGGTSGDAGAGSAGLDGIRYYRSNL